MSDEDAARAERIVLPVAVASLPWNEAWLLAGRLRSEGIPARVYPDYAAPPISIAQSLPGMGRALDPIGLGRSTFDVLVPSEFEERARAIVKEIESS